jgi:hypothetical protein
MTLERMQGRREPTLVGLVAGRNIYCGGRLAALLRNHTFVTDPLTKEIDEYP